MELLFALMIQSAVAAGSPDAARSPRLSYSAAAELPEPGVRINQSRRSRIDWSAMGDSLTAESRQEQPEPPAARPPRGRAAPGRESTWNGAPVRVIDGRRHGIW